MRSDGKQKEQSKKVEEGQGGQEWKEVERERETWDWLMVLFCDSGSFSPKGKHSRR